MTNAEALDLRERRRRGLAVGAGAAGTASGVAAAAATTMAASGAVAVIPAIPWTQIAALGLAGLGAGLAVAAKLKQRGSRALAGDERAVAGFAKRAARWSSAKRARIASRLHRKITRKRDRRETVRRKKDLALLRMKLGVLYGLEHGARKHKRQRLIADDAATVPEIVEANPLSSLDQGEEALDGETLIPIAIAGGLALALVVGMTSSKSKKGG